MMSINTYENDGNEISLDWNAKFIEELEANGFESDTNDEMELVMQWMSGFMRDQTFTDDYVDTVDTLLAELDEAKEFMAIDAETDK